MHKKLQVFISSTYTDLIEERQAAVQAVLSAEHIPAGMELFQAGNDSQLDTIKRWIDESDVYMLIIGGRYGSIEPVTGKSYTHLEYEYAVEKGKPVFAVYITKDALNEKAQRPGSNATDVLEMKNPGKYEEFKEQVLSRMCRPFNDSKDIKIAILESLIKIQKDYELAGWVSGRDIPDTNKLTHTIIKLSNDNETLRRELEKVKLKSEEQKDRTLFNGYSYEDIYSVLEKTKLDIPKDLGLDDERMSVLEIFVVFFDMYAVGIHNRYGMEEFAKFLYFDASSLLLAYGLLEQNKVTGAKYTRMQASALGKRFIAQYYINTSNVVIEKTV